ncbi:MAG: hypothetical protein IJF17_04325 [Thermoguttaceae bacterium]|nr:hypothetical protein [Thermoguttaceae bacterium]
MRGLLFFSFVFLIFSVAGADGIFVINEDDSHFFGSRSPEQMTLEGLHAFVDQYADTKVTHLFLCPGSQCACFASRTRSPIWTELDRDPENRWLNNAKKLHDSGLNPYVVWTARCREKKISPWVTLRMNDVHNAPEREHWIHSEFRRNNPQFWRVPDCESKKWVEYALNYAHQEVREYQLAFVNEMLELCDVDGIELDWMRFGYHLTPGKEAEEAPILTEFVADVRKLADEWGIRRGHKILVSVRVPTHPEAAAGLGMDAVRWAKLGLVDWIVPSPFWTSSDFDIPVHLWKERLAGTNVKLIPCLEHSAAACPWLPRLPNSLEMLWGWADTMSARGADGHYLFNWMDCQTLPVQSAQYGYLLKRGLVQPLAKNEMMSYPLAFRDTVPAGFPNGAQLPKNLSDGADFLIPHGTSRGKVEVILGLDRADVFPENVTLNGQKAENSFRTDSSLLKNCSETVIYRFSDSALKSGDNALSVPPRKDAAGKIQWVELRVYSVEK